jgi:signal transduction histidine kinase/ligand-binding sensor domain-containing protein/DNA-binding response OmpR family regulator
LLCSILFCGTVSAMTGQFIPSDRFSSGLINAMCQDQYGYMWIATENGLNKFDGYRFTTYYHRSGDSTSLGSNIVTSLYQDRQGQFWVGTRTGLHRYDFTTDKFVNYPFVNEENAPRVITLLERKNGELLAGTSGRGLWTVKDGAMSKIKGGYSTSGGNWYYNVMIEDSKGRFWKCGYGDEVTMMDKQGVHQFFVDQGIVACIAEFGDEILIICLHGISSYKNGQVSHADIDLSALGSNDVIMSCAFQDHEGNIYIGTRGEGLFRLPKGSRKIERVECTLQGMDLNTAKIWTISEDRRGNIWVGCLSKGLVILPSQQPQFTAWSFSAQRYFISSTITSLCQGDNGLTWCTVQGSGVFAFDASGRIVARPNAPVAAEFIYRDRRGQFWIATDEALYRYEPLSGRYQKEIALVADRINAMTDDNEGNLYISTFSRGFCIYNPETGAVKIQNGTDPESPKGRLCNNWVLAMLRDRTGHIWLATSSGVSCYDPTTDSFRSLGFDQLMDGMICFSLCETRQGDILIGTDQGLYRYTPGLPDVKPYSDDATLADKTIAYVAEAKNGDLWCATSMGIWQYDFKKQQFIGHVNGNGLTAKEYIAGVGMHTSDDVVYFANNDGLTVFRPSEVTGSHKQLPVVNLTGFSIAGRAVSPLTDEFSVSYLDNTMTLEFSLLDFNNPSNIIYEYRINKEKWIQNEEGQNAIQLSHLQPGTYNIEVRALSASVYSPTKTITVVVTPPWWRSTLAYFLYFVGLIGLVVLMGFMYRRRTHQQMDEDKMKFLINATHDIRSPLTLIMGAAGKLKNLDIEDLKSEEKLQSFNSSILQPSIEAIDRNANRLLVLVNQILDERRIDKNQMQLHCRETNLVDFISNICKLYQYNANQRNITFTFEHDKDHVLAWVDRINFDKVVSNLLSNAFKYTFDDGEVKVILRELQKDIEIQVIDNGLGFKGDEADKLFDRFYQGSNSASLGMQGTGIGLNLCRAITQMHGGRIKAQNRDGNERGAVFTVTIPKGKEHLTPEQIMSDEPAREVLSAGKTASTHHSHILITDDDQEIADYIIGELGDRYRFEYAPNGKEALKMLLMGTYDLVISDVMMPEMDGLQLLRRIKDNPTISQLPVIMLTSKAEVEYKLEGLKSGADAYIAKPFDMEELHIQIDNLIAGVRRLRGKFSGAVSQEERIENIEVKGNDEALMERIMKSVNANMSNPSYTVDTMAEDVGISRAQLHRKMKEMTGIATGKFLRNLRMEQAARLLREGKINVAQIADRVGYADQAHFSTAFKSHFGQSPSEYAETHHEE